MAKVKAGIGGRGTITSMESMKHPDSHFEMNSMNIKKADDGSYVIEHRMQLKKKHESKEMYHGSYREPETHTAADAHELMEHVSKHFGGKKASAKDEQA